VKIDQTVAGIWQIFYFPIWWPRQLEFSKIRNFNGQSAVISQYAPQHCSDIAIFRFSNIVAAGIMDFHKFKIFRSAVMGQ